jgi:hypothetical protein
MARRGATWRAADDRTAPIQPTDDVTCVVNVKRRRAGANAITDITVAYRCNFTHPCSAHVPTTGGGRRRDTTPDSPGARRIHHLVYVSILGIDQIPYSFYRRGLAVERRVEASGIPFTLVRATQFHSFVDAILTVLAKTPLFLPIPLENGKIEAEDGEMLETTWKQPRGRRTSRMG